MARAAETISTLDLFALFPDAEAARLYYEAERWNGQPVCPHCGNAKTITALTGKRAGVYRCREAGCKREFTVRTGTVMEASKIPLHKWLYAKYLVVTARKGISSLQLSKQIGVTQKSAWFLLSRIREACGQAPRSGQGKLAGIVEVDETYIGGKERNKHGSKKLKAGRGTVGKQAVVGLRARDSGGIVAKPIATNDKATLHNAVRDHVEIGATVMTDEHTSYKGLDSLFWEHETVNHSAAEYVRDMAHTNGIESVWAVLKRSINGTWHHVSIKHLQRYINEAIYRLDEANCGVDTLDRLAALVQAAIGKRLTYAELTA